MTEMLLLASASSTHLAIPGATDTLIDALTIEGLLFAVFAFALHLSEPTAAGRSVFFARAWFGWLFVLAITAAAVSAGASWWAAYHPCLLSGLNVWLRAGGLLSGILAPPIFAAIINWEARS